MLFDSVFTCMRHCYEYRTATSGCALLPTGTSETIKANMVELFCTVLLSLCLVTLLLLSTQALLLSSVAHMLIQPNIFLHSAQVDARNMDAASSPASMALAQYLDSPGSLAGVGENGNDFGASDDDYVFVPPIGQEGCTDAVQHIQGEQDAPEGPNVLSEVSRQPQGAHSTFDQRGGCMPLAQQQPDYIPVTQPPYQQGPPAGMTPSTAVSRSMEGSALIHTGKRPWWDAPGALGQGAADNVRPSDVVQKVWRSCALCYSCLLACVQ